jgi:hypothetical protein
MKLLKLLIILLFASHSTLAQSIFSYKESTSKIKSEVKFTELILTTTFYNKNDISKDIEYDTFDSLMNIVSLKRFDADNKLIWLSIYNYDSLGRLKKIGTKNWINLIGYQYGYTIYKYDSTNNFAQIIYNEKGIIQNICKYYFDKEKNLIRLELYNGNEKLVGFEEAQYDKQNNQMTIFEYNRERQFLNKFSCPISHSSQYKQDAGNKYNEHGDLIFWERNLNVDDKTCYTAEYKYDKFNNWVSEKRYSFTKNDKGELKKKKLDMIKTREIKYLNQ